jgi:hypothetical protein
MTAGLRTAPAVRGWSGGVERFGAALHALDVAGEGPVADGVQVIAEGEGFSVAAGVVQTVDHGLGEGAGGVEVHGW